MKEDGVCFREGDEVNPGRMYLQVESGDDRFLLNVHSIETVMPLVRIQAVAGAPAYVSGICNYRGNSIAVIDFKRLLGKGTVSNNLSARIVVFAIDADSDRKLLQGLLVEKLIKTIKLKDGEFKSAGTDDKVDFLDKVVADEQGLMHRIASEKLVLSRMLNPVAFNEALDSDLADDLADIDKEKVE